MIVAKDIHHMHLDHRLLVNLGGRDGARAQIVEARRTIVELLLNGGADVNAKVTPTAPRYRRHHTDATRRSSS
jgi:hypothetical protein